MIRLLNRNLRLVGTRIRQLSPLIQREHVSNNHKVRFYQTFEPENRHALSVVQKSIKSTYDTYRDRLSYEHKKLASKPDTEGVFDTLGDTPRLLQQACTPEELCNLFFSVTAAAAEDQKNQITIDHPRWSALCAHLVQILPEASDDQVIGILWALGHWPPASSTRSPNFKELWNALDSQCVSRCPKWPVWQLLDVAHLWANLRLNRITIYNMVMIRALGRQIPALEVSDVIQMLFFINLQRDSPPPGVMADIEEKLLQHVSTLSLDELSVACLGFFKTKSKLRNERLQVAIMEKVQSHRLRDDDVAVAAIVKCLRYSSIVDLLSYYTNLQRSLTPLIAHCRPQTAIHIVLLCSTIMVCSEEALTEMITRFTSDLKSLRLKEMSRSLYCVSLFLPRHHLSREYAMRVSKDLMSPARQDEIVTFPMNLISILLYLAYMTLFPESLITKCLNLDFITKVKDLNDMQGLREAYVLDNSVGLECEQYRGSRLSEALKTEIFKQFHHPFKLNSHQTKMTTDVQAKLESLIGGSDYCHTCHILPHFQLPDILILLDGNGRPRVIPKTVKDISLGTIIKPNRNEKWLAVVIGGRSFYLRDVRTPSGISQMKLRQLQHLGYSVIEIPWFEYMGLSETKKENYLLRKMSMFY